MRKNLNVYIVDDHSLFREGLHFLLSNSEFIGTIHEAKDGVDFIKGLQKFKPDIVLMDIEMPNKNGIEATQEALELFPDLKIIALSMYADESYYKEMLEVGALGFLLKDSKFNDVQKAIKEVFDGKNYFSPEILSSIINNLTRKTVTPKNNELTKREVEILINICQGLSNYEISEKLFISKRTVDKHRENILLKTQSRNTAELVVYAIKNDFFEI